MTDERRDSRRSHIAGVKVTYEGETGERIETDAVDLSPGGIFIRTSAPLAVGKRIALDLHVVGEAAPWPAIGRVIWSRTEDEGDEGKDKPQGMGLKLIGTDDAVTAAIEHLLDSREVTVPGVGQSSPPPAMPVTPAAPAATTAGAIAPPPASVREREPTLVGVGAPSEPPPHLAPLSEPPPEPVPAGGDNGGSGSAIMPALPTPLPHIPARRAGGGRGLVVLLLLAVAGIAVYVLLDGFLQPR